MDKRTRQKQMTKCWEFKLKLEKKTIKTFVYSDAGKDIESRFSNNKITNLNIYFIIVIVSTIIIMIFYKI